MQYTATAATAMARSPQLAVGQVAELDGVT